MIRFARVLACALAVVLIGGLSFAGLLVARALSSAPWVGSAQKTLESNPLGLFPPDGSRRPRLASFPDSGNPTIVASVMESVPWLLEARDEVEAIPGGAPQWTRGIVDDPANKAARRSGLEMIWASSLLKSKVDELEAALLQLTESSAYLGYTHARFTAERWIGVRLDGTPSAACLKTGGSGVACDGLTAFAAVDGSLQHAGPGGGWDLGTGSQWQVDLVHEHGGWRLVKTVGVVYRGP